MKIYTKTGDLGQTSLYGGKRIEKSDLALEAYGTVDELNSFIGFSLGLVKQKEIKRFLEQIQRDLLEIGSYLAGYPEEHLDLAIRVSEIENLIDKTSKKLPPLKNFIMPGGNQAGASLQLCRTVTRRAERQVVKFIKPSKESTNLSAREIKIIMYLNRLSDLFFILARYANFKEGILDVTWQ